MPGSPFEKPPESSAASFRTTHWSVVLAARGGEETQAASALETLCRSYWYPLYTFVRRQGHTPEDAEDLTQAFFARLLEKDYLQAASSAKGKFRSFLLMALKRFLADEWDRATALKRGGIHRPIPLDRQSAEDQFRLEPKHELTPERLFERRWAMMVLERARARLREEYVVAGKEALFEQLKGFHSYDETTIAYGDAATGLAMPENTVKSHVRRLRQRYQQLVREEVAQTVSNPVEVEEEIRHLLAVVGG
jgi:DNA-directed RNA polymerase specialized sigma24 family protein